MPSMSGQQSLTKLSKSRSGLGSRLGILPMAVKKRGAAKTKQYKVANTKLVSGKCLKIGWSEYIRIKAASQQMTMHYVKCFTSPAEFPCLPCILLGLFGNQTQRQSSEKTFCKEAKALLRMVSWRWPSMCSYHEYMARDPNVQNLYITIKMGNNHWYYYLPFQFVS